MNLSHYTRKTLGYISVDSGLVWIGDPCYILHHENLDRKPRSLGRTWGEFCDNIKGKQHESFDHDIGVEGLGVVSSTKHGDGRYPVVGLFEHGSDVPSIIIIDFDDVL